MTEKVLFSGSREVAPDILIQVDKYIIDHISNRDILVVVGDAEGVDAQVIRSCDRLGIPIEVHGAYKKMRRRTSTGKNIPHDTTYPGRDRIMAERLGVSDRAVIVWNGISRGTILTARAAEKRVSVVYWLWKKEG
jgi:predicted Rossmann fold nucleotide-binding protein DprA/Smf involved in DNA uptake